MHKTSQVITQYIIWHKGSYFKRMHIKKNGSLGQIVGAALVNVNGYYDIIQVWKQPFSCVFLVTNQFQAWHVKTESGQTCPTQFLHVLMPVFLATGARQRKTVCRIRSLHACSVYCCNIGSPWKRNLSFLWMCILAPTTGEDYFPCSSTCANFCHL